ncbi:hypothetical protein TWF718_003940 [Orbilia javanica]|uniref:Uncharacterized protein n=1 Tax=Orbilia javanica TaxID=47235 RepID=A0AAN8N1P8_9PEZI
MEHFAPFTPNAAYGRYENSELTSSIILVEDAVRQRDESVETYELDGGSHGFETSGQGLENLHEMSVPSFDGSTYRYAELPVRPPTTSPINDPSSPPPPQASRQTISPSQSTYGSSLSSRNFNASSTLKNPFNASSTLKNPFNAFDPEFFWSPNPTASPAPTPQLPPRQQPVPPRRRYKPIESPQFLPEYVVDNFLKANPGHDGFFCVFKKTYILKSDGKTTHEGLLPSNQTTLWKPDKVVGHLFEITWWGSMIYHGPFQDNEREFTGYWSRKSIIGCVKKPIDDYNVFLYLPIGNNNYNPSKWIKLDSLAAAHLAVTAKTRQSYPCALEMVNELPNGVRNLLSNHENTVPGTWRRIFDHPGYSLNPVPSGEKSWIPLFYMNVTKLVAYIVSTGRVRPSEVFRYMSPSKESIVVCGENIPASSSRSGGASAGVDNHPKYCYPSISLRIPIGEWRDQGWMFTELGSMGVLIS